MLKIYFKFPNGTTREFDAEIGQSLLDIAKKHDIDEIEGACGGALACATCHVIVDPAWYGKLPPVSMEESDMLELASGLTKTSRLGCQIKLTEALNGLTVRLPPSIKSLLG